MTRHIDESRLQDFQEGLLDPSAEAEVRAHLEACPECRERLEGLADLLDGLRELPLEARPARDLWPQIAWRMSRGRDGEEAPEEASVEGDVSWGVADRGPRITLPLWQLLAAGIVLMILSGSTVWAFLSRGPDLPEGLDPVASSTAEFVAWEESYQGYDEAISELEAALERGRDVLDPETSRVLEESLQAIDQAIQEAGDALRDDPASAVLRRFLADNLRKKVDLLRRATLAVYATT